jgi:hypothetical protein
MDNIQDETDIEDAEEVDVDNESHTSDIPSPIEEQQPLETPESEDDEVNACETPVLTVPAHSFGAVEIPMIIQNMDRAMRAFGRAPVFEAVSIYPSPLSTPVSPTRRHLSWPCIVIYF